MKKSVLLLMIGGLMASCSLYQVPYREEAYVIDYSAYKNFFISESNSVSFEYAPIGSVISTVSSGYYKGQYITASAEDAIYVLVDEARKKGANGIVNLKLQYERRYNKEKNTVTTVSVSATGMAIRR